jgi:hypothetical protein
MSPPSVGIRRLSQQRTPLIRDSRDPEARVRTDPRSPALAPGTDAFEVFVK